MENLDREVNLDKWVRLERKEKWDLTEETVTKDQSDPQVWLVVRETWDLQVVVDLQDHPDSLAPLISVSTL